MLGALVERDLAVLIPFGEGHPYDLVVQTRGVLFLRVQCKTARVLNGCLRFNSRSTDHGRGPGSYEGLADLFGVYCPRPAGVYLVPVNQVPRFEAFLRLEPTRNNQRRGVRHAADFAIDRWTVEALSELAERGRAGDLPDDERVAQIAWARPRPE